MVHHNGAMNAWTPEATNAFVARLESAERQIYPLAMVDTDRYERAVTLIGLLARHLDGSGDSAEDLELLRPKALTRLRGIASEQAIILADLDVEAVVDAALAQRYRVLRADSAGQTSDRAIEEARAAGETWASLESPDVSTLGFAAIQRWVDMHLETGVRLVRTISPDALTGHARFRIELLPEESADSSMVIDCESRQEWLDEAAALRQSLDGHSG